MALKNMEQTRSFPNAQTFLEISLNFEEQPKWESWRKERQWMTFASISSTQNFQKIDYIYHAVVIYSVWNIILFIPCL